MCEARQDCLALAVWSSRGWLTPRRGRGQEQSCAEPTSGGRAALRLPLPVQPHRLRLPGSERLPTLWLLRQVRFYLPGLSPTLSLVPIGVALNVLGCAAATVASPRRLRATKGLSATRTLLSSSATSGKPAGLYLSSGLRRGRSTSANLSRLELTRLCGTGMGCLAVRGTPAARSGRWGTQGWTGAAGFYGLLGRGGLAFPARLCARGDENTCTLKTWQRSDHSTRLSSSEPLSFSMTVSSAGLPGSAAALASAASARLV